MHFMTPQSGLEMNSSLQKPREHMHSLALSWLSQRSKGGEYPGPFQLSFDCRNWTINSAGKKRGIILVLCILNSSLQTAPQSFLPSGNYWQMSWCHLMSQQPGRRSSHCPRCSTQGGSRGTWQSRCKDVAQLSRRTHFSLSQIIQEFKDSNTSQLAPSSLESPV